MGVATVMTLSTAYMLLSALVSDLTDLLQHLLRLQLLQSQQRETQLVLLQGEKTDRWTSV